MDMWCHHRECLSSSRQMSHSLTVCCYWKGGVPVVDIISLVSQFSQSCCYWGWEPAGAHTCPNFQYTKKKTWTHRSQYKWMQNATINFTNHTEH